MKTSINRIAAAARLLTLGITITLLAACSQKATLRDQPFVVKPLQMSEYRIRAGDSLSGIAGRLTSTESNWQEIARLNGVTDPNAIQVGDTLLIPTHMLKNSSDTAPVKTSTSTPAAVSADKTNPRWVFQASSSPGVVHVNVELEAVQVNRSFDIIRADEKTIELSSDDSSTENEAQIVELIRVIGSYYPKGIYQEPQDTSQLIMRATPGTLFRLERKVGDWLRIETEKGIGYIRALDAELVEQNTLLNRLIASNNS